MSTLRITVLFKQHPKRRSTTPFPLVREEEILPGVEKHILQRAKGQRDRLSARIFNGYRLEFVCVDRRITEDGPLEIWMVYHSDPR